MRAAGVPPIDFSVHRGRVNQRGASEDFEQMLALLVEAVEGEEAGRLNPDGPGDWGIDVLVGTLNGRTRIWQAKYFLGVIDSKRRGGIHSSFHRAMDMAERRGYTVEEWTLCVPCSLGPRARQWWNEWNEAEQAEHRVRIRLWDETQLRRLLLQREAAYVREAFYNPYQPPTDEDVESAATAPEANLPTARTRRAAATWRDGDELCLGDRSYLLHGASLQQGSPAEGWLARQAAATQIEPRRGTVWLSQVRVLASSRSSGLMRGALRGQARLLATLEGTRDMPRLLDVHEEDDATTIVLSRPSARTWRASFRAGPVADRFGAASVLDAVTPLAMTLGELHHRRYSHRVLSPDAILIVGRRPRAVLRDVGLAGVPPTAGEGPPAYRAPEQQTPLGRGAPPGHRTDIYQLALIIYETLTGRRPRPGSSVPPVRATVEALPRTVDELLLQALDDDPRRRPTNIYAVATSLRVGREELTRGAGP